MLFEDQVRAIRESAFFHGMPQEEQMALARLGSVDVQPPGGVLFRPGDVPAALYVVLDGVVEICREESIEVGMQAVAYLGYGSLMCESKVLTGSSLTSLGHFPEGGTTLQWPRPILLRQLYSSRDLALHYLQGLARRLEGAASNLSKPPETDRYYPVQPLLFEAARIQDEFAHFAATVPDSAFLNPSARHLTWNAAKIPRLVEEIWHQLSAQPCGWALLAELLPYCCGRVALAVRDMLLAGVITADRGHEVSDSGAASDA